MSQTQYKLMSCSCNRPDHMFLISGGSSAIFHTWLPRLHQSTQHRETYEGRFYAPGLEATLSISTHIQQAGDLMRGKLGSVSSYESRKKRRPEVLVNTYRSSPLSMRHIWAECFTLPPVSDTWWALHKCLLNK